MQKKLLATLLLIIGFSVQIHPAESAVDMNMFLSMQPDASAPRTWLFVPSALITLNLTETVRENLRGEMSLRFNYPGSTPTITVNDLLDKVYVKARFPHFQFTLGKTRLSWGDGVLFNAADVLFPVRTVSIDALSFQQAKSNAWQASSLIPISSFSFIETAALFNQQAPLFPLEQTDFGLRFYSGEHSVKFETGYANRYTAQFRLHIPYIALQGNIGADWYLAASCELPESNAVLNHGKTSLQISGGLYWLLPVPYNGTLSIRIETMVRPWLSWKEQSAAQQYALLLYSEISYSPGNDFSIGLRSVVSPIDLSAMIALHGTWNVLQNFTLMAIGTTAIGEPHDLCSLGYPLMLTFGATWKY